MTLESGKSYSLTEIFQENRIIIPDLQRDYCWGTVTPEESTETLAQSFITSLIDLFNESYDGMKQNSLGLIYAYENPAGFVNIADGQQRLTTLYLLLCVLRCQLVKQEKCGAVLNKVDQFLVLDPNKHVREPRLNYNVRESTLYFTKDFVNNVVFKTNGEMSNLEQQGWYRQEYSNDPTVENMTRAVKSIEEALINDKKWWSKTPDWCLAAFARFLLGISPSDNNSYNKYASFGISFIYFDVCDRSFGEKMYVIINTRGAPMEPNEHIKPLLLTGIEDENQKKKWAKKWEEWQDFFWQNKLSKEASGDQGFNDFIRWYVQIVRREESVKPYEYLQKSDKRAIDIFEDIDQYFEQLKQIWTYFVGKKKFKKVFDSTKPKSSSPRQLRYDQQLKIILPLLEFMVSFPDDEQQHLQFLRRLRKNHFDSERQQRRTNYVDWRHVIQIIEKCDSSEDVMKYNGESDEFKNIANVETNVSKWYNEEEKIKESLKTNHKSEIEKWEDHKDFMGDLTFLIQASLIDEDSSKIPAVDENTVIDIGAVKKIYDTYTKIIDSVRAKRTDTPHLYNLFRLFNVFTGCNKVRNIYRTSGFKGVLFSAIDRNHLGCLEFMKLLNKDDIKVYCERFIKSKVKEEHIFDLEENFTPEKLIKVWLTLKVFNANAHNVTLDYYDGRNRTGVCAYNNSEYNKIFANFDFCIENAICGFGVKSGRGGESYIHYTADDDQWNKPNVINTPFGGILYFDRDKYFEKHGSQKELNENKEVIQCIKDKILND